MCAGGGEQLNATNETALFEYIIIIYSKYVHVHSK